MRAEVDDRARRSLGTSGNPIYRLVARVLADRHPGGGTIVDVGCGTGNLLPFVRERFARYVGSDVVRYNGLPADAEFHPLDLDTGRLPLPDGSADVAVAVEVIEHLENPRALVRELTRLVRPGGWVVVTTPNQLSLLSKLGLVLLDEFPMFRGANYPAHLTALLEIDLRRMAAEGGWRQVAVAYTGSGRAPGTGRQWPAALCRLAPRLFSDNVCVVGQIPGPGGNS